MTVSSRLRTNVFSMRHKPKLIVSPWVKTERLHYECSACGHKFLLEDTNPRDGAKALWGAFTDHVRNEHPWSIYIRG
jgi:hypothetical protein